jgi:tRNA 2-selenouridine synthase
VYVEAESNKIGRIALPGSLHKAMHTSRCVMLDTVPDARLALLLEDYRHLIEAPERLILLLQVLHQFQGQQRIEHWIDLIQAKQFDTLVQELLEFHYDPSYLRALGKHYTRLDDAQHLALDDLSKEALLNVAIALQNNP